MTGLTISFTERAHVKPCCIVQIDLGLLFDRYSVVKCNAGDSNSYAQGLFLKIVIRCHAAEKVGDKVELSLDECNASFRNKYFILKCNEVATLNEFVNNTDLHNGGRVLVYAFASFELFKLHDVFPRDPLDLLAVFYDVVRKCSQPADLERFADFILCICVHHLARKIEDRGDCSANRSPSANCRKPLAKTMLALWAAERFSAENYSQKNGRNDPNRDCPAPSVPVFSHDNPFSPYTVTLVEIASRFQWGLA